MDTRHLFPNRKIYDASLKGFQVIDAMHPDWVQNLLKVFGPKKILDLKNDALKLSIIDAGGIINFFLDYVNNKEMLEEIKPEHFQRLGMADHTFSDFEVYAATWTGLIKGFIFQGITTFKNMEDGKSLHEAMGLDNFHSDEPGDVTFGPNEVNQKALADAIGPKNMIALHMLYHSVSSQEFHDFLISSPDLDVHPFELMGEVSRTIMSFILPKDYEERSTLQLNQYNARSGLVDQNTLDSVLKLNDKGLPLN